MAQEDPWAGFGSGSATTEDPWGGFEEKAAPPDTSGFDIRPEEPGGEQGKTAYPKPTPMPLFKAAAEPEEVTEAEVGRQGASRLLSSALEAQGKSASGAGHLLDAITTLGGLIKPPFREQRMSDEDLGALGKQMAEQVAPPVEGYEKRAGPVAKFLTEQAAPVVGGASQYMAAGALGGPAVLAGGVVGATQSAGQMYDQIMADTGDPEKAMKGAMLATPGGFGTGVLSGKALERLPIINKITGGLLGKWMTDSASLGFGSGVQGGIEAVIRNKLGGEDLDVLDEIEKKTGQGFLAATTLFAGGLAGRALMGLGEGGGRSTEKTTTKSSTLTTAPSEVQRRPREGGGGEPPGGGGAPGLLTEGQPVKATPFERANTIKPGQEVAPEASATPGAVASQPQEAAASVAQGPEAGKAGETTEINLGDRRAVERANAPERRQNEQRRQTVSDLDKEAAQKASEAILAGDPEKGFRVLQDLATERGKEIEKAQSENEKLKLDALTDPGMGIPNKRAWKAEDHTGQTITSIDADGIGAINDQYGHDAGDKVFDKIAQVFKEEAPERSIARVGGDEFFGKSAGRDLAEAQMQRIKARLDNAVVDLGTDENGNRIIKRGIGISWGHGDSESAADAEMYQHKARRTEAGERIPGKTAKQPGIEIIPKGEAATEAQPAPPESAGKGEEPSLEPSQPSREALPGKAEEEPASPGLPLFKKPPESKRAGALDLFGGSKEPPVPPKDVREEEGGGYEHINEYLGAKQLAEQTIDRNAITYKQRVRDAGEDVGLAGRAVDFYAALQAKGEQGYDAFASKIPENERDAYEYAKTAPPEVKAVWDQMLADKKALGEHAESQIPDFKGRENYTMQAWKPLEGQAGGPGTSRPKFGLSTPREESRTFPTILEGLAAGRERAMPEGFENYARSGKQLTASIEARRLKNTLDKSGLTSTTPHPGWPRVESSKLFDSAEYRTPEGEAVKVSLPTYAEPETAKALNKIIAVSKLQGIGPIETMKRINNAYRASIFYTGLFHPRQFIAREILSSPRLFKNPISEYSKGLEAIRQWDDQTQLLVKNGLRLFQPQDFTPALDAEKGRFEKAIDAIPGGEAAKNALKEFGDKMRRFTFERLGAAYKLMGAKAELAAWQTRHSDELRQGTLTLEDGAKAVATAHNDLWGGQNWERILLDEKGLTSKLANPTMRDVVGLGLNTPDWTTSKLRLFVKAFERGEGADVRRLMWARTITRAAAATVGANLMMSLFDDKDALDRYKAAWKASPLHLADVDWTPLHDAVFGADHARHYFGVVGALQEPLSWMIASGKEGKTVDPIKGPLQHLRYRESFLGKLVNDALEGSDPIGRAFTGTGEMLGTEDRGRYKSSGPGRYKGQKKESLAGQFNSYKSKYADSGMIGYDQTPSFIMGEGLGAMPVQLQALYGALLGQLDLSQALGRAAGFDVTQAKPPEPKKKRTH